MIDLFLLGTVLYIFSVGLYELFIDQGLPMPGWLRITTLDDLKERLLGVVAVLLAVTFLGSAVTWKGGTDILALGLAIGVVLFVVSLTIAIMARTHSGTPPPHGSFCSNARAASCRFSKYASAPTISVTPDDPAVRTWSEISAKASRTCRCSSLRATCASMAPAVKSTSSMAAQSATNQRVGVVEDDFVRLQRFVLEPLGVGVVQAVREAIDDQPRRRLAAVRLPAPNARSDPLLARARCCAGGSRAACG